MLLRMALGYVGCHRSGLARGIRFLLEDTFHKQPLVVACRRPRVVHGSRSSVSHGLVDVQSLGVVRILHDVAGTDAAYHWGVYKSLSER